MVGEGGEEGGAAAGGVGWSARRRRGAAAACFCSEERGERWMFRQFSCWGQCLAGHAASASPPRRGDVGAEDGRTARARGRGEARGHTTTRADVRSRSSSRGPRRSALFMPSPSVPTLGDARGHTLALRGQSPLAERQARAVHAKKENRAHKNSTHAPDQRRAGWPAQSRRPGGRWAGQCGPGRAPAGR